eukprot:g44397.t1
MGLASSSGAAGTSQSAMARIVSPQPLSHADPIWTQGLEELDVTLSVGDLELLEAMIDTGCAQLVKNHAQSGNLRTMLQRLATELAGLSPDPAAVPNSLLNLLFLSRVFLNYGILNLSGEQRAKFLALQGPVLSAALPAGAPHQDTKARLPEATPSIDTSDAHTPTPSSEMAYLDGQIKLLAAVPATPAAATQAIHLRLLLSLIRCLACVRVTAATEDLHLEVCNLFIVLCSTKLVHTGPVRKAAGSAQQLSAIGPFNDPFLWLLMTAPQFAYVADSFVKALLANFTSNGRASTSTGTDEIEPTEAVAEIAAAVAEEESKRQTGLGLRVLGTLVQPLRTLLWLPVQMFQLLMGGLDANAAHPLAERSAMLCLLLVHQGRLATEYGRPKNLYQDALARLDDEEHSSLSTPKTSSTRKSSFSRRPSRKLSFSQLYDAIAAHLPDEGAILLLYSLLQGNLVFRSVALARTDQDLLVLPVLEVLYSSQGLPLKTNRATVIMIILLILSQDTAAFGKHVHKRLIIRRVPWFREMFVQDISLGSLIMAILLLMVQQNLTNEFHDRYLDSTCLATLSNLAQTCEDMHSSTARRLVTLMDLMARRYCFRGQQQQQAQVSPIPNGSEPTPPAQHRTNLLESLRLVLEVINTCVSQGRCASNAWLMYWLLIDRKALKPLKTANDLWDQVGILVATVAYFENTIESPISEARPNLSVEQTLETIRSRANQWNSRQEQEEESGSPFAYEEQERPEEFFLPYIWSIIQGSTQRSCNDPWNVSATGDVATGDIADEEHTTAQQDSRAAEAKLLSLLQTPPLGRDEEARLELRVESTASKERGDHRRPGGDCRQEGDLRWGKEDSTPVGLLSTA